MNISFDRRARARVTLTFAVLCAVVAAFSSVVWLPPLRTAIDVPPLPTAVSPPLDRARAAALSPPLDRARAAALSPPLDRARAAALSPPLDRARAAALSPPLDRARAAALSPPLDRASPHPATTPQLPAAPEPATAQPTPSHVLYFGDSLAWATADELQMLLPDTQLDALVFGGTAPCDWSQGAVAPHADDVDAVVFSFIGNNLSDCTAGATGDTLLALYRGHLSAICAQAPVVASPSVNPQPGQR